MERAEVERSIHLVPDGGTSVYRRTRSAPDLPLMAWFAWPVRQPS